MIEEIQSNIDKITDACNTHRVKALYLFGSAARQKDFDKKSDIDFLVEFTYTPGLSNDTLLEEHLENIDLLKARLESITKREIDLLQEEKIHNKFLKYFINKEKKLIYGIS